MSAPRRIGPALPLQVWLTVSHLVVLALPVTVLVGSGALAHELRQQTREDLEVQASLVGLSVAHEVERLREGRPDADVADAAHALGPMMAAVKETTLASIRIVDLDGVVVATSGDELGADLSNREEVANALAGAASEVERPRTAPRRGSLDSKSRFAKVRLFHAQPIEVDDRVVGAVVLARTPREEVQALYQLVPPWGVLLAVAITVALAATSGAILSRSMRALADTAHRVADQPGSSLDALGPPSASHVREVADLATAFARTAARLQARLAYIGEFASNVAHEFRTPITTLRGTVELLRDDDAMPGEQRTRFLDNALAELLRLDRLVGGLLSLARAEERGAAAPVALADLLDRARDRATVEAVPATIVGDAAQLGAVVENLVENARRHGGPHVAVRGWAEGAWVGFDVVDDGPGIAPENLARVFDRFFTTARGAGGNGLGLALVRAIVEQHGGEVTVASAPGRTCFTVRLPAA